MVCAGAEFVIAGSGGDTFRAQGMYAHPGHSKVVLRSPYQHASILLKTAQKGPFCKTQTGVGVVAHELAEKGQRPPVLIRHVL